MIADEVLIAAGAVVSVVLLALAALACLAALAAAAFDRLDPSPDVRLTDADIAWLCADDRMEVMRRHLDELWEADENPRDSLADAALDYLEMVQRLPERKAS